MAVEIKMPKMGIDMVEGAIARWLKSEGDTVKAEEAIAEIETDKSTVEMSAPQDGVLLKILVPEDQLVPVGTVVAYVGEAGESLPDSGNGAQSKTEPAPVETTGRGDPRGRPAPESAPTPETTGRGESETRPAPESRPAPETAPADGDARVKASPVARRLAREKGYDIATIPGTGPGGRIVMRDVEGYQPGAAPSTPAQTPAATPTATPQATAPAPAAQGIGQAEEVPLSRMRRRISEVLTASKAPVPHFYVTMDVDMEAAMALREQMNQTLTEEGIKISVNDLVVKATALALKKFPNINASFGGDKIIRHGDINVGIAVSTPAGLMTIATRNTDRMALSELSKVTRERAGRAREGKVQADDIGATTFTVSNLGMYGVDSFIAVITPPEAAILAVGGIRAEPVVKEGQIVVGQRMKATISADHRVTDGAEAAEFMVEFKRLLENPMRLML